MFSPYYAWAGRRDPLDHCAINVALYGAGGGRWAMTERGRSQIFRTADTLVIGPSAMIWDGTGLTIQLRERAVPHLTPVRGTIRVHLDAVTGTSFAIDRDGRHHWHPIAPVARVDVTMERPALRWSGPGYLDANDGCDPLETGFRRWDWSRAPLGRGAGILYDAELRDGGRRRLALRIDRSGGVTETEPPPRVRLPSTLWRVERRVQAEASPSVRQTLEDAPFYARSILDTRLFGQRAMAVHESLDLDRFGSRWVKCLLPFRMPRVAG